MTKTDIQKLIDKLPDQDKLTLLSAYGHELTIQARDSYEFQGPGVKDPALARACNEILHRVFTAIQVIANGSENRFPINSVSGWIAAENRKKSTQWYSLQAFNRALRRLKNSSDKGT